MIRQVMQWLSKMSRSEQQQRAAAAAVWMSDSTLNTALSYVRMGAINRWYQAQDPLVRERAWLFIHAVDEFTSELKLLVEQEQVNQLEEDAQKRMEHSDLH